MEINEGDIYSIPLFVSHDSSLKSYSTYNFGLDGQEFCFLRVIEDLVGAGILVEIFRCKGGLDTPIDNITQAPRLFEPVTITGSGIHKKRWRKIGSTKDYDKERDSEISKIKLVMGGYEDPRIWHHHQMRRPHGNEDIGKIEDAIMWRAHQLEKRVIKALAVLAQT